MSDREWMTDGNCLEVDPDLFFPGKNDNARKPKEVCAACPVAAQCLQYAIDNEFDDGIWGGLNGRERRKLANRPKNPVREKYADKVNALRGEGMSNSEIGRELDIPRTTVAYLLRVAS